VLNFIIHLLSSRTMPVSFVSSPSDDPSTHNSNALRQDGVRPSGSAGAASLDALSTLQQQEIGSRTRIGAASDGVVAAPGSQQPAVVDQGNAPSARQLTKDEADRLYAENMEDEYAKREGGA
jgi:hypothetical protein